MRAGWIPALLALGVVAFAGSTPVKKQGQHKTVQVTVVGKAGGAPATLKLLIDTGAGITMLTQKALKKLGVDTSGWESHPMGGVNESRPTKFGTIARLKVAGQTVSNLRVAVLNRSIGDSEGLLGNDVLGRYHMELNETKLTLHGMAAGEETWRVVMYWDKKGSVPGPAQWTKLEDGIRKALKEKRITVRISHVPEDQESYARLLLKIPNLLENQGPDTEWNRPYRLRFEVTSLPFKAVRLRGTPGDQEVSITPIKGGMRFGADGVETIWRVEIGRAGEPDRDRHGLTDVTLVLGDGSTISRKVTVEDDIRPGVLRLIRARRFGFVFENKADATQITKSLVVKGTAHGRMQIDKAQEPVMFIPTTLLPGVEAGRTTLTGASSFVLPHKTVTYFALTDQRAPSGGEVRWTGGWMKAGPISAAKYKEMNGRDPPPDTQPYLATYAVQRGRPLPNLIVVTLAGGEYYAYLFQTAEKTITELGEDVSRQWKEKAWAKATGGG